MSKSTLSIWASIFFVGFIAGFFVVVGFKYGVSPDQIGVLNIVLQHICTIEKNNQQVAYNCSIFVPLGIILSIVAGLASISIYLDRSESHPKLESWFGDICSRMGDRTSICT